MDKASIPFGGQPAREDPDSDHATSDPARRDPTQALAPDLPVAEDVNQGDGTRRAILDAVVRCLAAQGWAGTSMSLVAREAAMTRGKIQYYFPILEDLKYAAIEYLHEQSRRNYFERIDPAAPTRTTLDTGVDLMWNLARDPIHIAMAEVANAARTDAELRQRLDEILRADEAALDEQASATFPLLAAISRDDLKLGRHFTTIFINGLAAHRFPDQDPEWQARLIAALKEALIGFWARRGVTELERPVGEPHAASASAPRNPAGSTPDIDPAAAARTKEALELIRRAAELLEES